MSENSTKRSPLTGRKRYIAIAALASLVATGGIIGATVTSESTVMGNQVTITQKPATDAVVNVTGSPVTWSWQAGDTGARGHYAEQTYTLTNTGETDATVKVQPVANLVLESSATANADDVYLMVQTSDGALQFQQKVSTNPGLLTTVQKPITVPAGETIEVKGSFFANTSAALEGLRPGNATFDLQFDYVNKQ